VATAAVDVDRVRLEAVLERFKGDIVQTPPMYSALKHQGKPLYEYARAGTEIERAARKVTIRVLDLESFEGEHARIRVACSKGTYIRVLAEDIGKALGCGATLAGLRRSAVGPFSVASAVTLDDLERMPPDERLEWLLPADTLLEGVPRVALDVEQARRTALGQSVPGVSGPEGMVRMYRPGGEFLGVAQLSGDGTLSPRRLVSGTSAIE
jgi:tRNA pseudouridine55 synthase